jgi:hypothetical protein
MQSIHIAIINFRGLISKIAIIAKIYATCKFNRKDSNPYFDFLENPIFGERAGEISRKFSADARR